MFFDNLFDDFNPFGAYSYRQPRPQTSTLFRNDNHSIMCRNIINDEYNYMCFDCHREINELEYFDIKNGIFLCYNCAQQHAKLSKEITQPMTGNIRSLEDKDLLILYYGGNKNLLEFIRRHYPLLENMKPKEMYSTKAMDYYRKLLRSKAYDEEEPEMPGKKKAYTSIFQNKISPATERKQKNIRDRRLRDPFDRDDDRDNIFSNTFFGDDLFNRNKQQRKKTYDDENENENNNYMQTEPADINRKENEEKDDAGMRVEKRNKSNEKQEKENKHYKKINHETKHKKIEKKDKKENEKEKENEIKVNTVNTLTINQIGEMSRYPDAMEIDGMECE
jgi:hypothetical protein